MSDRPKIFAGQNENLSVLSDSPAVFAKTATNYDVIAMLEQAILDVFISKKEKTLFKFMSHCTVKSENKQQKSESCLQFANSSANFSLGIFKSYSLTYLKLKFYSSNTKLK